MWVPYAPPTPTGATEPEPTIVAPVLRSCEPSSLNVSDFASPSYKHDIVARAEATGIGEADIRRFARREFALAARNDSNALREVKLRDAINRAGRGRT